MSDPVGDVGVGVGGDIGDMLFPVRRRFGLTAAEVLREHTLLAERLLRPTVHLVEYAKGFAEDAASKAGAGKDTQMMFYPFDMKQREGPFLFLQQLGRDLQQARDYQVSSEMVHLAQSLFEDAKSKVQHLDERELPSDYGFMWMDEVPDQKDVRGRSVATHLITWGKTSVLMPGTDGGQPQWQPGVRLTFWTMWDVPEGTDEYTDEFYAFYEKNQGLSRAEVQRKVVAQMGNLTFSHSIVMPFGVRFTHETAGFGDSVVAMVHVIWMLMDMEFVTTSHQAPVIRNVRRRALRTLKHGEVNVIMLRRAKYLDDSGDDKEHRHVNWSCRWIVQGHWRHYRNGNRVWIKPYIKGPDGLTIKDTRQLWRLAR